MEAIEDTVKRIALIKRLIAQAADDDQREIIYEAIKKNATRPRAKGQNPDTGTPWDFFNAANLEFNFVWDLAATADNTKVERFISPEQDSLKVDWIAMVGRGGWAWLNPPFGNIGPWAKKCAEFSQAGGNVCMLVPASVGAKWFREWVKPFAEIRFLNPRLKFIGHDKPFPKDCMLAVYHSRLKKVPLTITNWEWK